MYVCVCNALSERQVKQAVRQGVRHAAEVYKHFSVHPRCGRCIPYVREILTLYREKTLPD